MKIDAERHEAAKKPSVQVFKTMREARPRILSLLMDEVRRNDVGDVTIVGGRIRSIIELIREIGDELDKTRIRSKSGCKIQIYMMRPEFVRHLILPGHMSEQEQLRRNEGIASQMEAAVDELAWTVQNACFRSNNITIEVSYYDDVPFGYYYLFGRDDLVFGGYIWSEDTSDMIGPASPCWHVTERAPEFESMAIWLRNRVALYHKQASGIVDLAVRSKAVESDLNDTQIKPRRRGWLFQRRKDDLRISK